MKNGYTPLHLLERLITEEENITDDEFLPTLEEVVRIVELIIDLRESNWEAGLFFEYREDYEEEGSHNRMRRWVDEQQELFNEDEENRDLLCDSLQICWYGDIEGSEDEPEESSDEDKEFCDAI